MPGKTHKSSKPARPKLAGDKPVGAPASDSVSPKGAATRIAALDLLQSGIDRRGGFEEAMARASFTRLASRDRAFAHALASTTLRRLGAIDRLLSVKLQRTPPTLVLNLLRLGVAQLLYMDVSDHAAVFTSVEAAAAQSDSRPFKGLINAVLRGLERERANPSKAQCPSDLSPQTYAPEWLFNRWRATYGEATAAAIAARIPVEPATDVSLLRAADIEDVALALDADILPGGSLRTHRRGGVADWPGFDAGVWWVQDAAAAIPARLLGVGPGDHVLDLCAAPGGKTLQLAAAGATVTAVDRSASRLDRLAENLKRLRLSAEIVSAEVADWADRRTFDAVLLDAPCTATGTFRRHPDVLWAAKASDLAKLAALQARLLDSAARRVRPGGRLVYCVCSLEAEEGEAQMRNFLGRHSGFSLAPVEEGEAGAPPGSLTLDGGLRIHPALEPPEGGMDGFFAARFIRTGGG